MLDFTPGGHSGSNLLSTDSQQDCQLVQHTGKQPDYLDVLSLPAVVRLGALENAVLAAVNKAEAAGLTSCRQEILRFHCMSDIASFGIIGGINCHVCRR